MNKKKETGINKKKEIDMTNKKEDETADSPEEIERIKKLIEKKEITAITVDTNIFIRNGFRLHRGAFAQLKHFQEHQIKLVLSNVVVKEMTKHLAVRLKEMKVGVNGQLRDIRDYIFFNETPEIKQLQKKLTSLSSSQKMAEEHMASFIKESGAIIVNAQEHIDIETVLDHYFENREPFQPTNKKKNEFPDAMVLLSLQSWARENDEIILGISDDGDWDGFCESSSQFHLLKKLQSVLSIFQFSEKRNDQRIEQIRSAVEDADSEIGNELRQAIYFYPWNERIKLENNLFFKYSAEFVFVENIVIEHVGDIELIEEKSFSSSFEVTADIKFEISGFASRLMAPDDSSEFFTTVIQQKLSLQITLDEFDPGIFFVDIQPPQKIPVRVNRSNL